jgi:hypothetical protein
MSLNKKETNNFHIGWELSVLSNSHLPYHLINRSINQYFVKITSHGIYHSVILFHLLSPHPTFKHLSQRANCICLKSTLFP